MTYCYRCSGCEARWTEAAPAIPEPAEHIIGNGAAICGRIVRDYRAEAVGVNLSNLRSERA